MRNGYTQRFTGTLMTLVSHCAVLRVGESLREGRKGEREKGRKGEREKGRKGEGEKGRKEGRKE